jgi:hypothetical protein
VSADTGQDVAWNRATSEPCRVEGRAWDRPCSLSEILCDGEETMTKNEIETRPSLQARRVRIMARPALQLLLAAPVPTPQTSTPSKPASTLTPSTALFSFLLKPPIPKRSDSRTMALSRKPRKKHYRKNKCWCNRQHRLLVPTLLQPLSHSFCSCESRRLIV